MSCEEHCEECLDVTLECVKCSDGYYLEIAEDPSDTQCRACDPKCATCEDSTSSRCPTCADGYVQYPGSQQCESYCPSGLESLDGLCVQEDTSVCFEFLGKQIELESHDVTIVLDGSENDPVAAYQRGIYFYGTSMRLKNLVLNTSFSIEIIIRPDIAGDMLKIKNGDEDFLKTDILNNQLAYMFIEALVGGSWQAETWYNMAIVVDGLSTQLYINGETASTELISESLVLDHLEYVHTFGEGYTGFLYKLCVHQYAITDFDPTTPPDCPINQTPDCEPCPSECSDGPCVKAEDCSECVETLCEECPNFADTCEKCIDNAIQESGLCECQHPNYYQSDIKICDLCQVEGCEQCEVSNECIVCQTGYYLDPENKTCGLCHSNCSTCLDETNENCPTCSSANSHRPDSQICMPTCPSGSSVRGESCEWVYEEICFLFDDKRLSINFNDWLLTIGLEDRDDSPKPMYNRGLYFDGNDQMIFFELLLNHVFTVELWIRPYIEETPNASLITISPDFADFNIRNGLPTLEFDNEVYSSLAPLTRTWQNLAYIVNKTLLAIYINGEVTAQDILTRQFIDQYTHNHTLGIMYQGFVYNVCTHQKVVEVENFDMTTDHACVPVYDCEFCPKDECLSNCEFDEYLDQETRECGACEPECVTGCMRPTDCSNCLDELCQECNLYDACDQCVPNAHDPEDDGSCTCIENHVYSCEANQCLECPPECESCDPCSFFCNCKSDYFDDVDGCTQCDEACAECNGPDDTDCPKCKTGFVHIPDTLTCRDYCPSAFTKDIENHQCTNPGQVCFTFDDKTIELTDSGVTVINDAAVKPISAYERGLYFTTEAELSLPALILNTKFTLEFIVRPESHGHLMTILTNLDSSFAKFEITRLVNIAITQKDYGSIVSDVQYAIGVWQNIALKVDLLTVEFLLDNVSAGPVTGNQLAELVVDSPDNHHVVGREYAGFLYKFCVYQFIKTDDFITPDLSNCEIDDAVPDCIRCEVSCQDPGCLRPTDCGTCKDPLCVICEGYTSPCEQCVTDALVNQETGQCECKTAKYYDVDTNACADCFEGCAQCSDGTSCELCSDGYVFDGILCVKCDEKCDLCTGTDDCSCDECADGYAMRPNTQCCQPDCPTGYISVEKICEVDPQGTTDVCQIWDDKDKINTNSEDNGGDNHPSPSYNRGLYFDGDDYTFLSDEIILNTVFTLEFWIKPEGPGSLLSIIPPETGANFGLDTGLVLSATIGDKNATGINIVGDWTHVAYAINVLEISFFANGELVGSDVMNSVFIDTIENTHNIGTNYLGFIYSICIKNRQVDPSEFNIATDLLCTVNECSNCPDTCVSNCPFDQYIQDDEEKSCADCSEECTDGCIRGDDCRLCLDPYCETCPTYGNCDVCLPGAYRGEDLECVCDNYDQLNETCSTCNEGCSVCEGECCIICSEGFYKDQNDSCLCLACPDTCTSCISDLECTSCDFENGFVIWPDSPICLDYCPSGIPKGFLECDKSVKAEICFEFTDIEYEMEALGVQIRALGDEATQPFAVYQRGLYFRNGEGIELEGLILSCKFTLEFFLRPDGPGTLLHVTDPLNLLMTSLPEFSLRVQDREENTFTALVWSPQTWNHVVFFIDLSTVTMGIDSSISDVFTLSESLIDHVNHAHTFGAAYSGFVYRLCVHQYIKTDFDTRLDVPDCDVDQMVTEDGKCEQCAEECETGCIRHTDCRTCVDPNCAECDVFDGKCSGDCITGAVKVDDICVCEPPKYYLYDIDECSECKDNCSVCTTSTTCNECDAGYYLEEDTCLPCLPRCELCSDETNEKCDKCSAGYTQLPDSTICVEACPTGYVLVEKVCVPERDDEDAKYCYVFDDKKIDLSISPTYIKLDNDAATHPIPMYARGLYFSGEQFITIKELGLSTSFTLEFWIRPFEEDFISGSLMQVNTDYLVFSLESGWTTLRYADSFWRTDLPAESSWMHVTYAVSKTVLDIFINGVAHPAIAQTLPKAIIDLPSNDHMVGVNYIGFLYSICLTQSVIDTSEFDLDLSPQCNETYDCTSCPKYFCLSNCENDKYVDLTDSTCGLCDDGCETGCFRDTDCRNCIDMLCKSCSLYGTCETCVEGTAPRDSNDDLCVCQDGLTFSYETAQCGECKSNCLQCTTGDLGCELCEPGYFINDQLLCQKCNEACATCSDETDACDECAEGYYRYPSTDICKAYCPSGLIIDDESSSCLEDPPVALCYTWDDKTVDQTSYGVQISSSSPDTSPQPVHQKGIYFEQDDELLIPDLVLNTKFTLEFIVRPESNGSLFLLSSLEAIFNFAIAEPSLEFLYKQLAPITDGPVATYRWHNLVVFVDLELVTLYIDGRTVTHSKSIGEIIIDSPGNSHKVGQDFTGLIYKICVHQFPQDVFDEVPMLPDCGLDQNENCEECDPECEDGCIRTTDCRLCEEVNCETCEDYEGPCDTCITGAELVDGTCLCQIPKHYQSDIDECAECQAGCDVCSTAACCEQCADGWYLDEDCTCKECPAECATCVSSEVCTECKEGNVFLADVELCAEDCPSGYEEVDGRCQLIDVQTPDLLDYCFVFDDIEIASIDNVSVTLGVEPANPVELTKRGLHFDGDDTLTINNLLLNSIVTLETWIKPESSGDLMTIGEIYFIVALSEDLMPSITRESSFLGTTSIATQWTNLAVQVENKIVRIFVNGVQTDIGEVNSVILDSLDYSHIIGSGYTGFIYRFCIKNRIVDVFDIDPDHECSGNNDCTTCPFGVCLSECAASEFIDDGECLNCSDKCTEGCDRETDCRLCIDELCLSCPTSHEVCEECVPGAEENSQGQCECTDDTVYDQENEVCTQCAIGCEECNHGTLDCTKCEENFYLDDQVPPICQACHEHCEICSDSTNTSCDKCREGFFLYPNTKQCHPYCPSALENANQECLEIPEKSICLEFTDNDVDLLTDTIDVVLAESGEDPFPVQERGIYFQGQSIELQNLVINTRFTLEFVVRPESNGNLLNIGNSLLLPTSAISESRLLYTVIESYSGTGVQIGVWQNLAITVDIDVLTMHIDNVHIFGPVTLNSVFVDSSSYVHTFGHEYTGFLYKLCIHQYAYSDPFVTPTLNDCPVDQTIDCEDCLEECVIGCIRPTDCRSCEDVGCLECESFDGECIGECIEGEVKVNGNCECQPPLYYQSDLDQCTLCPEGCATCISSTDCPDCSDGYYKDIDTDRCTQCDSRCALCEDGTNENCEECSEGNAHRPRSKTCTSNCPTGFIQQDGECIADGVMEFCFRFDDKEMNIQMSELCLLTGETPTWPKPMYERGLYFDGDDYMIIEGLILNTTFTLEFWIRPGLTANASPELLSINTDYLVFSLKESAPAIAFAGDVFEALAIGNEWKNVAYIVDLDQASILDNGVQVGEAFTLPSIVIDQMEYPTIIGSGYVGFLYSLCIKQVSSSPTDIDLAPPCDPVHDCTVCPTNQCLSNCEFDQYLLDDRSCDACQDGCITGCIRPTDCRNCHHELCETCFMYKECELCIETAQEDINDVCQCANDWVYKYEDEQCAACPIGCDSCQVGTHECDACLDEFYLVGTMCFPCHERCAICTDDSPDSCTACTNGNYLFPGSTHCQSYCPIRLIENSETNECVETGAGICISFNTQDLGSDETSITVEEGKTPYPVYKRGLYLPANAELILDEAVLNTKFTIEFTIWPETAGSLLMVKTEAEEIAINVQLFDSAPQYDFADQIVSAGTWTASEWQRIAYVLDRIDSTTSSIQIYVNGIAVVNAITVDGLFIDSLENTHYIGRGYTGFLYGFCMDQDAISKFDDDLPDVSCPPNQNHECLDCPDECAQSCFRTTDCHPCKELLCTDCPLYIECDVCIPGAVTRDDGVCTCPPPKYFQSDIRECQECMEGCEECSKSVTCDTCKSGYYRTNRVCELCASNCATCSDGNVGSCLTCVDGTNKWANAGVCDTYCPTGFTATEGDCILTNDPPAYCYVFDDKVIELVVNEVKLTISTDPENGPVASMSRGLYFDGTNSLVVQNFVLNTSFTLEYWIRFIAGGELLAINSDSFVYKFLFGVPSLTTTLETHAALTALETTWTHISLVVDGLNASFFLNGTEDSATVLSEMFVDTPLNSHVIGGTFTGFMYSFCLNNYVTTTYNIDLDPPCQDIIQCATCPIGVCLSECEVEQYIEEDFRCGLCREDCNDGCIRPDDCRLCNDPLCEVCAEYDTCAKCVEAAGLNDEGVCECLEGAVYQPDTEKCGLCDPGCCRCNEEDLICQICCDGFYLETTDQANPTCIQCPIGCETCTGPDNCPVCSSGYYHIPNTTICHDYCPTALLKDGECAEEPKESLCFTWEDKSVPMTDNNIQEVTIVASGEDTYPVFERGIYFDKGQGVTLEGLVLNTRFTFEAMIRMDSPGELLKIVTPDEANVLLTQIANTVIEYRVNSAGIHTVGEVPQGTWTTIAIAIDLLDVHFYVDGVEALPTYTMQDMIVDTSANVHTFGIGYEGFLYKLCIHQYAETSFDTDFPIDCGVDTTGVDPCDQCPEDCTQGCRRPTDCRSCQDPLCETCDNYDTPCEETGCIENATYVDGLCVCSEPNYYQSDIDECKPCPEGCDGCSVSTQCTCLEGYYSLNELCAPCDERCETCTDGTNTCEVCAEGYSHLPDTLVCVADCPSGFTNVDDKCIQGSDIDYCFVFNDKIIELVDADVSISVANTEGSTSVPMTMISRGLYFDGNDKLDMVGLILNTSFTLEFWIRPYISQSPNASLMTVDDGYADFGFVNNSLALVYEESSFKSSSQIFRAWTHVAYVADLTTLSLYTNGNLSLDGTFTLPSVVIDYLEYSHTIGMTYIGFIYSICITQAPQDSFTIVEGLCTINDCLNCPTDDVCLSNCEYDQTIDKDTSECLDCSDECEVGCIREKDCGTCSDVLCEECDTYDTCNLCIDSTLSPTPPCECPSGQTYSCETHICDPCRNNCLTCTECEQDCLVCEQTFYLCDVDCCPCNEKCDKCLDETNNRCDLCAEGYYQFPHTQTCEEYCPTALELGTERNCLEEPLRSICFVFSDKLIEQDVSSAVISLPADEALQPFPVYQRGIYYNRDAYVMLPHLVLNTRFTLEFMIRPEIGGNLMQIENELGQNVLRFDIVSGRVNFTQFADMTVSVGSWDPDQWYSIALSVDELLTAKIYIQNATSDQFVASSTISAQVIDSLPNSHAVGIGYQGLLYKFCIYQYIETTFDLDLPINCPVDQTADCEQCPEECEQGCVNTDNCNPCLDPNCEKCQSFEGPCAPDSCIPDSVFNEVTFECECNPPNYYHTDTGLCKPCIADCKECSRSDTCQVCQDGYYLTETAECGKCSDTCGSCTDASDESCTACKDGAVLLPDVDSCASQCPSGFDPKGEAPQTRCVVNDPDYCFTFDDLHVSIAVNDVILHPSSASVAPIAIISRGLHFNGEKQLEFVNLVLNTIVTVDFWIRPEVPGSLLKINDYLEFLITEEYKMSVINVVELTASQTLTYTWTHIAFIIENRNLKYNYNGNNIGAQTMETLVLDQLMYPHVVGISYTGFLWQICIKNRVVSHDEFNVVLDQCLQPFECTTCPEGTCLSECEYDQFIEDDKSCNDCKDECKEGCARPDDCGKCDDQLCKTCASFDVCEECVIGAELGADGLCQCLEGTQYNSETGQCGECNENCEVCTSGDLCCIQCADGSYLENCDCLPCNPACATCPDDGTDNCPTCNPGYFKFPNTTRCETYCPTALTHDANTCFEEPNMSICVEWSDKTVVFDSEGVTNVADENSPTPVYDRGIYFDGTALMTLEGLILNTRFTLEFIIRPDTPGSLLTVTNSGVNILSTQLGAADLQATFHEEAVLAGGSWEAGQWYNMGVEVDLLNVMLYVDGVEVIIQHTLQEIVSDRPEYDHTFGEDYTGMIKKICIHQYVPIEFDLEFPFNCSVDQYLDPETGECADCLDQCIDGCRYSDNCSDCDNRMCTECDTLSGPCTECHTNAELMDGDCVCIPPNYYQEDINRCELCVLEGCSECHRADQCDVCADGYALVEDGTCQLCHEFCSICSDTSNENCTKCSEGNYLQPSGPICLPYCPTGYEGFEGVCWLTQEVSCYVFDDKTLPSDVFVTVEGNEDSELNPIPIVDRGVYFDGSDSLIFQGLTLNSAFTLEFWIRPDVDSKQASELLTIDSTYIVFAIESSQLALKFETQFLSASTLEYKWTNVAFIISEKTLQFFINGSADGSYTFSNIMKDQPDYTHIVGTGYIGFLFKICLSYSTTSSFDIDSSPDCTEFDCTTCPVDTCLSNCALNEFIDSETRECVECLDECEEGCIRATDCILCTDENCEECPEYDTCYNQCEEGTYLFPNTDLCRTFCPSNIAKNDKYRDCDHEDNKSVCIVWLDNQVVQAMNDILLEFTTEPHPFEVSKRGIYMYKDSALALPKLVLNTVFTLEFIVRPELPAGGLLTIIQADGNNFLTFDLNGQKINLTQLQEASISRGSWAVDSWYSVGVTVDLLEVQIYLNNAKIGTVHTLPEMVIDHEDNEHYIGRDYQGLMYKFCVHQFIMTDFDSTDGLPDCSFEKTPDCTTDCLEECTEGCNRDTDCRKCDDVLCIECPESYAGPCVTCIPNTINDDGVCVCEPPNYYQSDIDVCEPCPNNCEICERSDICIKCDDFYYLENDTCQECDPRCQNCTGAGENDCTFCAEGYFMLSDFMRCETQCPTGFSENADTRVCEADEVQSYCFEWRGKSIEQTNEPLSITKSETDTVPNPLDYRGLHFDGNDVLTINNLILNTFATLEFWVKPEANGALLDISGEDTFIQFILTDLQPQILYEGNTHVSDVVIDQVWTNLVYQLENLDIKFYIDRSFSGASTAQSPFIDQESNTHTIGLGYVGFIYKICIHAKATLAFDLDVTPDCTEFDCSVCPIDFCLSNCSETEFISPEDRSCDLCEAQCEDGCVRATDCRKCYDELCLNCDNYDGTCTKCIEGAQKNTEGKCECMSDQVYGRDRDRCGDCNEGCDVCEEGTLCCTECAEEHYNDLEDPCQCALCYERCKRCVDGTSTGCTECLDPYSLIPNSSQCEVYCPSGLVSSENMCDDSGEVSICFTFNDIGIMTTHMEIQLMVNDPAPFPVQDRGAYFTPEATISFLNLVLNTKFTLEYLIKPVLDGQLLTIVTDTQDDFMITATDDPKILFKYKLDPDVLDGEFEMNVWQSIGISVDLLDVIIYVNGNASNTHTISEIIIDRPEYHHTFGNSYEGFLYKLCLHQYDVRDFDLTPLNDCDVLQTIDCLDCLDPCTTGCVRDTDCRICEDPLCETCQSYTGPCNPDGCIANTTYNESNPDDSRCECNPPHYYQTDIQECDLCPFCCDECSRSDECITCSEGCFRPEGEPLCIPCDDRCSECTGETNDQCQVCSEGNAKLQGTEICESYCPSGFIMQDGECVSVNVDYCFVFDDKNTSLTVFDVTLDITNPLVPVYKRGVYFDGSNTVMARNLVLNPETTLEFWILPFLDLAPSAQLFTINTNYLIMGYQSATPVLLISGGAHSQTNAMTREWTLLSYVVKQLEADIYINGVGNASGPSPTARIIHDNAEWPHEIALGFAGFIYSICIKQEVPASPNLDTNPPCTINDCTNCPIGVCLSHCERSEYFDVNDPDHTCDACMIECTDGCIRGTDCRTCVDEECAECPESYETCVSCMPGTVDNNGDCECQDEELTWSSESQSCTSCEEFCDVCRTGDLYCLDCEPFYWSDVTGSCIPCNEACEECTDGTNQNCQLCAEGYYKFPDTGVCESYCPSGLVADDATRECVATPETTLCLSWLDNEVDITDNETSTLTINFVTESPFAVQERGIYFNPEDSIIIQGLVLNTKFTLEMIIRPELDGDLLRVCTEFNAKIFLSQLIDMKTKVTVSDEEFSDDIQLTTFTWSNIGITVDLQDLRIHLNNSQNSIHTLSNTIIDTIDYDHIVGKDYQGFIYQICIHQFAKDEDFNDDVIPNNCEADQTTDCEDCLDECDEGCIRTTDCRKCVDPFCLDCDGFEGDC